MEMHVDVASRLPIYQQLANQIREAIARGDLQPEAGLPSVRQLSKDLVVNPSTVHLCALPERMRRIYRLSRVHLIPRRW